MDEPLARHLVHEGDRVPERVLHRRRVTAVNRGAYIPQRAAEPGPELPIVLASTNVLTMGLERGVVTSHSTLILESRAWDVCDGRVLSADSDQQRHKHRSIAQRRPNQARPTETVNGIFSQRIQKQSSHQ